jgi:succinylarginine dihydrolase
MSATFEEVIFIGLPGPYHNYSGLSEDNVASNSNRYSASNPKEAALQALELAALLKSYGITVAILPPLMRPHMASLNAISGSNLSEKLAYLAKHDPQKLERIYSSSAMWTANAATIAPSCDTTDQKLHLTVANLNTKEHRRIEAEDTYRILSAIFVGGVLHPPLDASLGLRDEGAANHTRLCAAHGEKGLHLFVYGANDSKDDPEWARQTLSASKQVAAQHMLPKERVLLIRQNPDVIKKGVFHNDVIAVGHLNTLLYHEDAYGGAGDISSIQAAFDNLHSGAELCLVPVYSNELSVEDAVITYLFNSQLISTLSGDMALIAPSEVKEHPRASAVVQRILNDKANPINHVQYVDLKQSMCNGGGPACLRLRVVMTDEQIQSIKSRVNIFFEGELQSSLTEWINKHYSETLSPQDLADIALVSQTKMALDELSTLIKLPIIS